MRGTPVISDVDAPSHPYLLVLPVVARDVRLRLDADDSERCQSTELLKKKERDLDRLIDTLFENMAVVKGNVLQESSRYTEAITCIVSATDTRVRTGPSVVAVKSKSKLAYPRSSG